MPSDSGPLMLGLSLKVSHHALNNYKSFLLNAEQVSILCGTHRLDLVFTNLGKEDLVMEMEEGPHDLCLAILHTFLLKAWVEAGVVLGFFGRFSLDGFQFGFLVG